MTALAIAGAAMTFVVCIHPFLALTARLDTRTLVVEGWIPSFALEGAVTEIATGQYLEVLVTGGPVFGIGEYRNDYQTSANVGADNLRTRAVDPAIVTAVPARARSRDRTFGAAIALGDWLTRERPAIRSLNVLTEGCHARRTLLLYRKALGPDIEVGVISVANNDYDPRRWWRYSEGVRQVLSEVAAYTYARFFFWPGDADRKAETKTGGP